MNGVVCACESITNIALLDELEHALLLLALVLVDDKRKVEQERRAAEREREVVVARDAHAGQTRGRQEPRPRVARLEQQQVQHTRERQARPCTLSRSRRSLAQNRSNKNRCGRRTWSKEKKNRLKERDEQRNKRIGRAWRYSAARTYLWKWGKVWQKVSSR